MVKLEKIEGNKIQLEVEVPKEQVDEALERAYRKVVKKIVLPGFRKGKVPRFVLEKKLGPEVLYEDALEILLPKAYGDAVKDTKIEPIDQPQMDLVQMEKGKPLIFKATVEVKPEVQLGQYTGVEVEHETKEITDKDVDNYLEDLREQHARLVTLEDEAAQKDDIVEIDFKGYIDGKPFEGGEAEGYSLQLGKGTFIPGFEDQLLGATTGEEREVRVTFPENYQKEDLAGKEALFKVKVNKIKRKELPQLDEDFVKEISEEETLADFREKVKKDLAERRRQQEKMILESKLVEKVTDNASVEVPNVLVERELDRMLHELEYYLRLQGMDLQQYDQLVEGGLDKIKEERREEAAKKVKANLVLDAIGNKENLKAEEADIDEKIKEIAEKQDDDPERVKELFTKQGRKDIIKTEIRYRKIIDFLVENCKIVPPAKEKVEPEGNNSEDNDMLESEKKEGEAL